MCPAIVDALVTGKKASVLLKEMMAKKPPLFSDDFVKVVTNETCQLPPIDDANENRHKSTEGVPLTDSSASNSKSPMTKSKNSLSSKKSFSSKKAPTKKSRPPKTFLSHKEPSTKKAPTKKTTTKKTTTKEAPIGRKPTKGMPTGGKQKEGKSTEGKSTEGKRKPTGKKPPKGANRKATETTAPAGKRGNTKKTTTKKTTTKEAPIGRKPTKGMPTGGKQKEGKSTEGKRKPTGKKPPKGANRKATETTAPAGKRGNTTTNNGGMIGSAEEGGGTQTPNGPPTVKSVEKSSPEENESSQAAATSSPGIRKSPRKKNPRKLMGFPPSRVVSAATASPGIRTSPRKLMGYPALRVVSSKVIGGGKRKRPFGGDKEDVKEKKIAPPRMLRYPHHGDGAKTMNCVVRAPLNSSNLTDGGPDVLSGDASKKHDHKGDKNICADMKRLRSILNYFVGDGGRAQEMKSYEDMWARCESIYLTFVESLKSDVNEAETVQRLVVLYLALISVDKMEETKVTTRFEKETLNGIKISMRGFDWEGDNIGGAISHLIREFKLLQCQDFVQKMITIKREGDEREITGSEKAKEICTRIHKDL